MSTSQTQEQSKKANDQKNTSEDSNPNNSMRFIENRVEDLVQHSVLNRIPRSKADTVTGTNSIPAPERCTTDELMDHARSWLPGSFRPLPSRESSFANPIGGFPTRETSSEFASLMQAEGGGGTGPSSRAASSALGADPASRAALLSAGGAGDRALPDASTMRSLLGVGADIPDQRLSTAESKRLAELSSLHKSSTAVPSDVDLNHSIAARLSSLSQLDLLASRANGMAHPSTESAMRYVESLRSSLPYSTGLEPPLPDLPPAAATSSGAGLPSAAELLMQHRLLSVGDPYGEEDLLFNLASQRNHSLHSNIRPLPGNSRLNAELATEQVLREAQIQKYLQGVRGDVGRLDNFRRDPFLPDFQQRNFLPKASVMGGRGSLPPPVGGNLGMLNGPSAGELLQQDRLMSLGRLSSMDRLGSDEFEALLRESSLSTALAREKSLDATSAALLKGNGVGERRSSLGPLLPQDASSLGGYPPMNGAPASSSTTSRLVAPPRNLQLPQRNFLQNINSTTKEPTKKGPKNLPSLSTEDIKKRAHHQIEKDALEETEDGEPNSQTVKRFKPYHEEKWNENFQTLLQFKKANGNCLVPHTYPPNPLLARWVKRQRRQYKLYMEKNVNSTMTPARIQKLNEEGFVWDSHEITWMSKYYELIEYRKIQGHCRVPSCSKTHPQLATWVKCQRRQYRLKKEGKNSAMTDKRIELLDKIEFSWEVRAQNEQEKAFLSTEEASEQLLNLHKNPVSNCKSG